MLEKLRDTLKPISGKIAKYFTWIDPNVLTIIGVLLTIVPAYFFIIGEPRIAGFAILLTLFDFLDGAVARYTGKVSLFGEFLDATMDRIADGVIIFAIAVGGFVSWSLAFVVLVGSFLVSYTRARAGEASAKKVKLNVGIAQRGDRLLILFLASVLFVDQISIPFTEFTLNSLEIAFIILALLAWETVVVRILASYKLLGKAKNEQEL